jgi:hypothetical protein
VEGNPKRYGLAGRLVVERGMVDLGQGGAVGDDRLAEQVVGIGHDVRSVQQMIIRQVADRTSASGGSSVEWCYTENGTSVTRM